MAELQVVSGVLWSANCYLLLDKPAKKILIIDLGLDGNITGFPLRAALERLIGKNSREFSTEVFLTHCHIDHIAGENNLLPFKTTTFSASTLAAKHINSRDNVTLLQQFGGTIDYTVEQTYQEGERITIGDYDLEVLYCPGHTEGSAVLYDAKTKTLFSGDVVFNGSIGRMDLPTGDPVKMRTSLKKLLMLDIQHLYSGHGKALHGNVHANLQAVLRLF